ncbi:DUF317 domain-containing protein [Streptomyces sp. NPDC004690]
MTLEPVPNPHGAWWQVRGQGEHGSWHSAFGANTPVEILAPLTDALLQPPPQSTPDIWPALEAAGWHHQRKENGDETATHPDRRLSLSRWSGAPYERAYWTAAATRGHDRGHGWVWRASLDDAMPRHLLTAFVSALASDEPVQRGLYDVPHLDLVTQEERGPQAEDLAAAHDARLKAVRAAARKARPAAAQTARQGPPPTAGADPDHRSASRH